MKEKDIESLQHTTWRCQYHVVFAPKYRRMAIYGQIRRDIGQRGCRQNLGLIMQQSQDDVYTQSDSARPAIS